MYDWDGNNWTQRGNDMTGESGTSQAVVAVSLSAGGNAVAFRGNRGVYSGYVVVYLWDGSAWVQRGDTMYGAGDGDWFGGSIALSRNGSTIAIGSIAYLGYTRVYDWSGSEWVQRARLGNSR